MLPNLLVMGFVRFFFFRFSLSSFWLPLTPLMPRAIFSPTLLPPAFLCPTRWSPKWAAKQKKTDANIRPENRKRDRARQAARGEPVGPSSDSFEGSGGDDDDSVDASGTAMLDNDYFYAPAGMGDLSGALPPPPTRPPPPGAFRLFEDSHTSSASTAELGDLD